MVKSYKCRKRLSASPSRDYVLIETETDPSKDFPISPIRMESHEGRVFRTGQEFWLLSKNPFESLRARSCRLEGIESRRVSSLFPAERRIGVVDCGRDNSVIGLDSGSPVFDRDGAIVGVLQFQGLAIAHGNVLADPSRQTRTGGFLPSTSFVDEERSILSAHGAKFVP